MKNIGKKSKIRVDWKVSPYDYSLEKEKEIKIKIGKKYGIPINKINVLVKKTINGENADKLYINNEVITNIQNPKFQLSLFKKYLDINNFKDYDFNIIEDIDKRINCDIDYEVYDKLLDREAVKNFRDRALTFENPVTRGTAQNDDVYFQTRELQNKYYEQVPGIVAKYMAAISEETGRNHAPFVYYGAEDATDIIIAMGSATETIKQTVDYLNNQGKKVGCVTVHLYRPFSKEYLLKVVPTTVKRIAVLDRSKEPGANCPLYLDVKDIIRKLKGQTKVSTYVGQEILFFVYNSRLAGIGLAVS